MESTNLGASIIQQERNEEDDIEDDRNKPPSPNFLQENTNHRTLSVPRRPSQLRAPMYLHLPYAACNKEAHATSEEP